MATPKLARLRSLLQERDLAAYVIPHDDAHLVGSELTARASTPHRLTAELNISRDLQEVRGSLS